MSNDLVMLRYTNDDGERFVALCRPRDSVETLRGIIGDEGPEDLWCADSDTSAVVLDTSGPVLIHDSSTLRAMAFWMGVAAAWLRQREKLEEEDDGFDDL